MFSKVAVLCALVAVCQAGFLGNLFHKSNHGSSGHGVSTQSVTLDHGHGQENLHYDEHSHEHHDEHAHPRYEYKYSVSDDKTEDQKSHWETRDGDKVEGEYSLVQPDGSTRTVRYSADGHNGFKAEVQTTGGEQSSQDYQHPELYQQDFQQYQHYQH
ncbi:uncharacterized protein LOC143909597 [Arctopsyche grandis]|uniref:uncharacterized protein LOC143909597 n=1 Tax=Arctopsyche grandis TaxID=121162 RepID=UPI00406D854F